ncbi:hypothetical protein CRV15_14685 [Streptomyces clavuligerus]|uniref:Uncharacterized protein n=1 Tax=Streptomyces clavuligerus TaxID=1901 RepID=B5GY90_STRCL|nr:hypothetical protein D1794_15330 [Streptomyces clavuligerus]EDY51241.1 hypothetical protein SSCG_04221 [Streptomyces clavuligerus]EFG07837.1 Hypothetical protein SCLAV_2765 [Streptomyces clavuligerus]QCS06757.1 hypothetical protein CRV15_14685 [Streptomyces clavuligerus]QPJ93891.1 hypothetical protein GE265_13335 [Streptomyces clavuligerus]
MHATWNSPARRPHRRLTLRQPYRMEPEFNPFDFGPCECPMINCPLKPSPPQDDPPPESKGFPCDPESPNGTP